MSKPKHIPVLDHLRGLAALAVCLFHFSGRKEGFLPADDAFRFVSSFGWLGVEAFFVISGFVIPYSLYLRSYRISDGIEFLLRRLKRLEPPYLACILLVLGLNYLSTITPGFRGEPFDLNWQQIAAHIGYLNAILDLGWLNPVFWTLAIEFQFYVFMALTYPLIGNENRFVSSLTVLAIAVLGWLIAGNTALLTYWLPLFAVGMTAFLIYVGHLGTRLFFALLVIISLLSYWSVGHQQTIVGLSTALLIVSAGIREPPRILLPFAFLGTISYSLYLVHIPIGGRLINLATRLPATPLVQYVAVVTALGISVAAAYVFWLAIERRSQQWAKKSGRPKLRLQRQETPPTTPESK